MIFLFTFVLFLRTSIDDHLCCRPAFYLYTALKVASGLLILRINLEFKAPAQNVITDVLSVLKNVEMVSLFIVSLLLGENPNATSTAFVKI